MTVFNLTGLEGGGQIDQRERKLLSSAVFESSSYKFIIKCGAACKALTSCRRHKETALPRGMNQELSLGARSLGEVSLHKKIVFKKYTHGEIILPPYYIKYTSLKLVLQGTRNSFIAILLLFMQPQIDCTVLPLGCRGNWEGIGKNTLVWALQY